METGVTIECEVDMKFISFTPYDNKFHWETEAGEISICYKRIVYFKIIRNNQDVSTQGNPKKKGCVDKRTGILIQTLDGPIPIKGNFKAIINMLDPSVFIRIHQETVVNQEFIKQHNYDSKVVKYGKHTEALTIGRSYRNKRSEAQREKVSEEND
jgi:hypothetical protein